MSTYAIALCVLQSHSTIYDNYQRDLCIRRYFGALLLQQKPSKTIMKAIKSKGEHTHTNMYANVFFEQQEEKDK